jgi:hypothetical protein
MTRFLILALAAAPGCRPANGGAAPEPQRVTVHDVLTRPSLVGRRVTVTGRCLGYTVPTVAQGSPPVTRSDWQLEDRGEAVWVSGPLPEGCTATTAASGPSTIVATVAQDTLPALGAQGGRVRQYLIRRDAGGP